MGVGARWIMISFICDEGFGMDENQHIPESEASKIREFVFAGRKIEASAGMVLKLPAFRHGRGEVARGRA